MAERVHHVGHKKSAHIEICSSRQLFRMRGKRGTKSPVKSSRDVACAVSAMWHFCVQEIGQFRIEGVDFNHPVE